MLKITHRHVITWSLCLLAGAAGTLTAGADEVTRMPIPNSDFPISVEVTVPAGFDTYYLSGALADPTSKGPPPVYGDTEQQTLSVLTKIKATLEHLGLTMGDVVKMTIFMAGDPAKDNKMDFAGMMKSYTQFFATPEQPNKPARSAVQVAALAAPGALIEIEVIAVKAHPAATKKAK
jgi:enamine deaminase RidA (YjgF/YER057c/UK114 family)